MVDFDKKLAAENLLEELSSYHGPIIKQVMSEYNILVQTFGIILANNSKGCCITDETNGWSLHKTCRARNKARGMENGSNVFHMIFPLYTYFYALGSSSVVVQSVSTKLKSSADHNLNCGWLLLLSNALCEQDTNKRVALPRDVRNLRQLELVSTLELTQFCNPISLTKSLGNSTSIINAILRRELWGFFVAIIILRVMTLWLVLLDLFCNTKMSEEVVPLLVVN